MTAPHFRAGVVAVVLSRDGRVMSFERADLPDRWQLPQGGIEPGEAPVEAAWRELGEETGLGPDAVRMTGEHPRWTAYELPPDARRNGRLGSVHRWFFFEVLHDEVRPVPDGREFVSWRWADRSTVVAEIADFKRDCYRDVLLESPDVASR